MSAKVIDFAKKRQEKIERELKFAKNLLENTDKLLLSEEDINKLSIALTQYIVKHTGDIVIKPPVIDRITVKLGKMPENTTQNDEQ